MLTIAILMVELLISCLSFVFENINAGKMFDFRPGVRTRGAKPPQPLKLLPPLKHDGRSSATQELPRNIYSAIQILIVVCTVVFFVPIHTQCTELWFVVY